MSIVKPGRLEFNEGKIIACDWHMDGDNPALQILEWVQDKIEQGIVIEKRGQGIVIEKRNIDKLKE